MPNAMAAAVATLVHKFRGSNIHGCLLTLFSAAAIGSSVTSAGNSCSLPSNSMILVFEFGARVDDGVYGFLATA